MAVTTTVLAGAFIYIVPHRIAKIGEAAAPFGEMTQDIQRQIEEQLPAILPQNAEEPQIPAPEAQDASQTNESTPLEVLDEGSESQEPTAPLEIPEEAIR